MSENHFLCLACANCDADLGLCVEPNPGRCVVLALCPDCAEGHQLEVWPIDPGPAAEKT